MGKHQRDQDGREAKEKGRIAPPLPKIQMLVMRLLRASRATKGAVFLVTDKAELGHAGCLDDVQHPG